MKTTFKFIIAAMAATAVFASCQKEIGDNTSTTGQKDGGRVIYIEFDSSTKAYLDTDGLTPKFKNGDMIKVSGEYQSEDCEISVSGGVASFVTSIQYDQELTAIYPADAAVLNYDNEITGFKVHASQDGDIAKAIIAKAIIPKGESSDVSSRATFTSQIALFQVTPPDGVKEFTVTSLNTIESGARTGDAVAINTEEYPDEEKLVITVSNNELSTFYVALVPGVNLSDLSFEYTTDNSHGAMKGISTKAITAAGKNDLTAANTKYTINKNDWHPYVKINGKKWATENIGANASNAPGYYFAWGYTDGCIRNSSNNGWILASDNTIAKQFNTADFPNRDENTFQDAATANWGGAWRMPAKDEFAALYQSCVGVYSADYLGSTNVAGYILYEAQKDEDKGFAQVKTNSQWRKWNGTGYDNYTGDDTPTGYETSVTHIFLPFTGLGNSGNLASSANGYYWSSTISESDKANYFSLSTTPFQNTSAFRYFGCSIRPVSD